MLRSTNSTPDRIEMRTTRTARLAAAITAAVPRANAPRGKETSQ
jgi:hypothetical protein